MAAKRQGRKGEPKTRAVPVRRAADLPEVRFKILVVTLLMIIGVCALYPEICFRDYVFYAGDVEAAISYATPIQQDMADGKGYPLWNPYLYAGMPSYESLSYTPYVYLPGILSLVLIKLFRFPEMTWLLSHIFLLGIGVCALLMDRGVHFLIAAGAGVLMMWVPNHVAVSAHGHGSQAMAVAYIPFVLMLWDRVWRGRGVLLNASLLVILLGFQLLRAHLQISYYTLALLALHLLFFGTLQIYDVLRGRAGTEARPHFALVRPRGDAVAARRSAGLANVGAAAGIFLVIVIGALLISSVLFLPVRDYAQYSIRGASEGGGLDYDYATSWSLHPRELLTFVVPFASGFGKETYTGWMPFTDYPNYVGIVVALFALFAVATVRTRYVRFLAFVAVVATVVSFGRFLPVLYNPLFKFVPYFNKFRVPVMILIVQQFVLVLLFAIGLAAATKADPAQWRKRVVYGVAASAVLLVIFILSHDHWRTGYAESIAPRIRNVRTTAEQLALGRVAGQFLAGDLIKQALILLVTTTALLAFYGRRLQTLPVVLIVLLVGAIDFYMVDRHVLHPEKLWGRAEYRLMTDREQRDRFLEEDGVVDYLKADSDLYRVFPIYHPSAPLMRDFRTNRYGNFRISSLGGYHPAKLSIYQDFLGSLEFALKRGDYRLIDMLNTKYLIASTPLDIPSLSMVWQGSDYLGVPRAIYKNARAKPRVYFVDQYQVASGEQTLQMLAGGTVDPTTVALLDREPPVAPRSSEGASAVITSYGLNEIRISASLREPALMILSEIFYPRWRAEVNGKPETVLRANHVLRALALPAGDHTIVFSYDSSLLRDSFVVSVVTLSIALIVFATVGFLRIRGRHNAGADRHSDVQ